MALADPPVQLLHQPAAPVLGVELVEDPVDLGEQRPVQLPTPGVGEREGEEPVGGAVPAGPGRPQLARQPGLGGLGALTAPRGDEDAEADERVGGVLGGLPDGEGGPLGQQLLPAAVFGQVGEGPGEDPQDDGADLQGVEAGAEYDAVQQALLDARVEPQAVLRGAQRPVDVRDVVVEPAGLVQPGGGLLDGGAPVKASATSSSSRRIRRARSSMESPAVSTQTGGARTRLNSMPTTAPMRVSRTRSQAVSETWVTPRTSMALIATSGTNSSTRTSRPTSSEARMTRARLHQDRPTTTLNAMAMRTPTTTEFTRRRLVVRVE